MELDLVIAYGSVINVVDINSHDDWAPPRRDHLATLEHLLLQGITIVVGGGCSYSPGGQYVGVSVVGSNTEIADGVVLTDYRFDEQGVEVLRQGVPIGTRNRLLDSCIGHGAYLGRCCVLAPVRAVPNGWRIVPDRGRVLAAFNGEGEVPGHRVVRRPVAAECPLVLE